jgi:excisionase family DNA binding protein
MNATTTATPTTTSPTTTSPTTTSPAGDARGQREPLLTPAEVAALFRVDPKTVTRWAKAGRLACIRTLGGHRRYPAVQFTTHLAPTTQTPTAQTPTAQTPAPGAVAADHTAH